MERGFLERIFTDDREDFARIESLLIAVLLKLELSEIYMSQLNDAVAALTQAVQASSDAQAAVDTEVQAALANIATLVQNGDTSAASDALTTLTSTIAANTARQQADTAALLAALPAAAAPAPAPVDAPAPSDAGTPADGGDGSAPTGDGTDGGDAAAPADGGDEAPAGDGSDASETPAV